MTEKEKNIQELKDLGRKVTTDAASINNAVEAVRIQSPAKKVEASLTSYLTSRLDSLRKNDELGSYIQESIINRLPEFTTDELIQLYKTHGDLSNTANRDVMVPFVNQNEGTVVDTLRKDDAITSSQARELSEEISDRDQLQALEYLARVIDAFKKPMEADASYVNITPQEEE